MTTIQDIIDTIEDFAPLSWQETWDNAGVQVGARPDGECTGAWLCLDVNETTIQEAAQVGANLIVSHHPLIFNGLKSITEATPDQRIVREAIRRGITVYSAHTNIDAAPGGVNGQLANKLGLRGVEPLVPALQHSPGVGAGAIGELSQEVDVEQFLARIREAIGTKCLRHSELASRTVRRVALCGGNGTEFIAVARGRGADLYLTADIKYHQFVQAAGATSQAAAITLVDGGHHETERHVVELFYALISKKIPTFAPRCHRSAEANPVRYY